MFICNHILPVLHYGNRMKQIASSPSESALHEAETELCNSDEWQDSENLHAWFDDTWLAEKKVMTTLTCL